jgi:hypothetical protein
MKLKILFILFLILSIEGRLTRTKAKARIKTWVMSPTDFLGREIFGYESEDTIPHTKKYKKTHPIINIMLTTDDNFKLLNENMNAVFEKHNSNKPDVEEIKDMMKMFTVVWTDHPEPKKRQFIPFVSILEMKYINAEDKMVITTADGTTYVTKLSPSIDHSFLHRILFRLICLEYETNWLYYQELLSNGNKTDYILNLREYDFFPEELAILNLKYVKHIFRTENADQYLKQLNDLVVLLVDNGLYSELRGNTELTSLLKILRLLNVQNINFLHEVFLHEDEDLILKIMGNLNTAKGYFNLAEDLYYILGNKSEHNLMMRLITESSYLEFKTLKHIISLLGHVQANSTFNSLLILIKKGKLTLNDLKELQTLTKTEYFVLYESFNFEKIKDFLTLEYLNIEKLQGVTEVPIHYESFLKCVLSQYEDIKVLKIAEESAFIERMKNCERYRNPSQVESDLLVEYKNKILSYDEDVLLKIKYLLGKRLFEITFYFVKKFKLESVKKFKELKKEFEGKETNSKFKQYLTVIYKKFPIQEVLGEDPEILENIFKMCRNKNGEIKRFNYLLFGNNEGAELKNLLLTESFDTEEIKNGYQYIIENTKLNNCPENEFEALKKLLKENINDLVYFSTKKIKHIKMPNDKNSQKLFKLLNENKTLKGFKNLKSVVMHLAKNVERNYEWLQNDYLQEFEKYVKFPLLKSEAEKLLTIFHSTFKDKTFDELVNIVNSGVVEKLLQLQDLKFQIQNYSKHYEIFNKINSLINELGAVFFKEPFMMMIELKNEKKGLIEKFTNYFRTLK